MVKRKYGLPYKGCRASVANHMVPPDYINGDSREVRLDPLEGKWLKRDGSRPIGGVRGVVQTGATYGNVLGWQMQELKSDSLTNGEPTMVTLFGDDSTAVGISGMLHWVSTNTFTVALCSQAANDETVTTGTANGFADVPIGALIRHSGLSLGARVTSINSTTSVEVDSIPNSAVVNVTATIGDDLGLDGLHRNIGRTYGATHYPNNFKMVPNLAGSVGLTRCADATERTQVCLGARSFIQVGDELYTGNYKSRGIRWNKKWNDQSTTGSNNERVFPMGHVMPLWPPTVTEGATAGPTLFKLGEGSLISVIFQRHDGSFSRMCFPQIVTSTFSSVCLYTVNSNCSSLLLTNIAIGPDGTKARWIVRTPFSGTGIAPAPLDENGLPNFGFCGYIPNNTDTTFTLNTLALRPDPLAIRFDDTWPPPSRYLWMWDQRVMGGYVAQEPAAIVIAPFVNNNDETISADTYAFSVQPGTQILLYKGANTTSISAGSGVTIQEIVDQINITTDTGSNGGKWKAQLVPNVDANTTGDKLFDTLAFDIGDGVGKVRCFSNSWPGLIFFNTAYLANYPAGKRTLWFSPGGPGSATLAANNTVVQNRRTAPESWGQLMGGAPVLDGAIVCFGKAIGIFRNIKGGKSGVDEDYRLEGLNEHRGCISDTSIVAGDGWVGYLTADGYVITDGTREVVISEDMYKSSSRSGPWALTIRFLSSISAKDASFGANFHAAVLGSQIHIRADQGRYIYDYSSGIAGSGLDEVLNKNGEPWGWSSPLLDSNTFPGPMCVVNKLNQGTLFWFQGVAEVGSVPGQVVCFDYGDNDMARRQTLSCVTNVNPGTENIVTLVSGTSDQIALGASVSSTDATIRTGTVVLSKTNLTTIIISKNATLAGSKTLTFQGATIREQLHGPQDLVGSMSRKAIRNIMLLYRLDQASNGSGLWLQMSNRKDFSNESITVLPTTAFGFSRRSIKPPQNVRGPGDVVQYRILGDGTEGDVHYWGMEADIEVLDGVKA